MGVVSSPASESVSSPERDVSVEASQTELTSWEPAFAASGLPWGGLEPSPETLEAVFSMCASISFTSAALSFLSEWQWEESAG